MAIYGVAEKQQPIGLNKCVEEMIMLPDWEFDDEFDGGEETCGRVIVNLHLYVRDQAPGRKILVISRDPGAPVEIPAWCRMTRNLLTRMQHPYYLITLKPEFIRSKSCPTPSA